MKLGETIRIFRIANEYSIKQLAENSGVSSAYITNVEKNEKQLSLKSLEKIAKVFEVPASAILKISELSEEGEWNYQKTLLETLKIYVGE